MPLLTKEDIKGLPGWVFDIAAKITAIDKTNELYDKICDYQGPDFACELLRRIGVDYQIGNHDRLSDLPDGPFITISNHPYGSIDGIMLVDLFGHLRPDFKVMVNKFLSCIKNLNGNWITVVPTGKTKGDIKAESIKGVKEVLTRIRDGHPVGFFPSGAVSDFKFGEGVRDREWQAEVIRLIKKCHVPIVPVRFFDKNTPFFYALGLIDWRIRVARLPREMLNKGGKIARLGIGNIISVEDQDSCSDLEEFRKMLRDSVYGMSLPDSFILRSAFDSKLSEKHGHSSDAQDR